MADDDETPYSNTGLKRWEAGRKQWLDIERSRLARPEKMKRAVNVDIDLVIDRIFSPESDGTLPHAVPLPQLIDLMTDLWEADGLFD